MANIILTDMLYLNYARIVWVYHPFLEEIIAVKVCIIESLEDLNLLEEEWNELLHRSSADSVFLTWEWTSSWLEVYKAEIQLFVITVRDEAGKLQAVAPLYYSNYKFFYILGRKILRVLGDRDCGAEYSDWIVAIDVEVECYALITSTLKEHSDKWDCIWIPNMMGWEGAHFRLLNACQLVGLLCNKRNSMFDYFALPSSYDEYEKNMSSNRRSQLRRRCKKVLDDEQVNMICCESEKELPAYLESLFILHHKRRMLLGDMGTFRRKPQQVKFYKLFTQKAIKNQWLVICALKDGRDIKAIQLGYIYNNIFHQMQEGFDPDYHPGAGNVLRAEKIRQLIEFGVEGYDFLGGVTEHKRRWLAKPRTGYDVFIGKKSIINYVIFKMKIWPTGRYLKAQYTLL